MKLFEAGKPALSLQISDLEDELGLKLFERNSRGVELTEAGRAFLVGGRRVLAAATQAIAQAQEAANGERGRLVVGSISPLTSSFLPVALARFREQRPLVEATVLHMNNRAQVEAVLNGAIMLGIGFFDSAVDEDEHEQLCTRRCFVRRSELVARNIAGFQNERRQSSETFVTTNSCRSIQSMDMGTSNGSAGFASGLASLSLRSERWPTRPTVWSVW